MATSKGATASVEVIPISQVVKAKRGRKPNTNPDLLEMLRAVPEDGTGAAVLAVFADTPEDKRASVGSVIRSHWKQLHGDEAKARIQWNPATGTPQVSAKVSA